MDSSGYKFNMFQVLLSDDSVRRPKHVAVESYVNILHAFYVYLAHF